jgi:hypothetical protein
MKSIIYLSCAVAFFQVQTAIAQGTCQQNYVVAIKNCGLKPGVDPKTYSQSQRDCIKSAQAARKTCIASATRLITTPALSSDIAVKLPPPPAPPPDNSWSGFYAGVNGGYGSGSAFGGAHAGYNWQLPSSNWVGGFEAEQSGH